MNNKGQRNRLFTMLLLVMAILMPYEGAWAATNVTTSRPAQGDGSSSNPFQISNAKELAWFREWVNGTYTVSSSESATTHLNACAKLTADIDLKDFCHAADASQNLEELSWVPIGNNKIQYQGTFDGNGKTITNLYINASQTFMGLFGYTYQSTIKNLTFENANVTNTQDIIGILVGGAGSGSTLQNIKISETCQIKGGGNYTGGIAGILYGNAYNCVNYATVQGKEKVGGLFGSYQRTGNSIIACANYGNVTATSQSVGGLVGEFSGGTIQDCANYGNVKGTESVAGLAGYVHNGKIQNVFSYGNISATKSAQDIGMSFGYSKYGDTEGMVAYYSGAKLTANSQEITVKAFGSGNLSEDNATGFTETQLKSGVVAYLLQQNASSEAKWGQNLANNGDSYPVIGSKHQVYADNLTLNCKTYKVVKGSLTNNPTSSAIRYQHGQTINHHAATNATCTEAATKEYWQCQDCQRIYSDSQLTKELTDVTDAEHPALGHTNNEDGYCDRCKHYVAVKPSEQNGVYLIAKPCHLAWFRDYVNGTIVDEGEVAGTTHSSASAMLTADIDLKNYCHAAEDGKELFSWIPIGNYDKRWKGNMDGQGHTISHLYIKTAQNYVGLFGFTEDATIQNIIFDNVKVENVTLYTGILAGYACGDSPSHIKGIKTTNNCTLIGQRITGGIVGEARINLENCENHSSVKGTSNVGGIAGSSTDKNIKRCTNYGTVENNNSYIGGIIGYASRTSIEDCANYGKITSTGWCVGGIAGQTLFNSSIQNVFSYGDVTNTNDNPGIIIGCVNGTLPAKGIVTYNKEALLNNSSENIPIVGNGSLTFEDGKVEADVVKAFTKQQIKSGEVAWLLNGSTSTPAEGSTLVWYQKLGENGDEYPVLTPSNGNTVYNNYYTCGDKQVNIFSNTEANAHEKYDKHVKGTETLVTNGLYSSTCQRCENNFMYIKDFCGIDGNDLELTANTDGSYTTFKPVDINDDAPYNSPVDFTAPTLNYTRDYLGADQWQAVYVPFETQATDWTNNGITVASINNFHEYEKEDGSGYETVLEVKKATSGEFEANTPYLLRTNDSGSKTITINNAKLHKSESKTYYCMSMTRKYDFTGIYTPQSGLGQDGVSVAVYALNKKGCIAPLNPSTEVGAQRWYLTVSNRNGSNMSQASKSRSINIDEVGAGATTAIEGIQVITNNEADKTSLNGIYDLQGRKLSKEPTQGIYIKNGKKYVKFKKLGI